MHRWNHPNTFIRPESLKSHQYIFCHPNHHNTFIRHESLKSPQNIYALWVFQFIPIHLFHMTHWNHTNNLDLLVIFKIIDITCIKFYHYLTQNVILISLNCLPSSLWIRSISLILNFFIFLYWYSFICYGSIISHQYSYLLP